MTLEVTNMKPTNEKFNMGVIPPPSGRFHAVEKLVRHFPPEKMCWVSCLVFIGKKLLFWEVYLLVREEFLWKIAQHLVVTLKHPPWKMNILQIT